ncbi:hypothetical protein CROQUDRAFT_665539 [Cronartium quercuum f. sp. fusiforme G11]|uniref:Non-ribosomal peptide synthetase n=1 Tax=Cronartium quercuum f. sp. fusiforme G11 TaxID=708437 RepID=A0A9P6N661_9BASI|nr:hypothetical protein CROQUDRAFT_665539 [Cronartium quercuum f. sp. fusiforme G11]
MSYLTTEIASCIDIPEDETKSDVTPNDEERSTCTKTSVFLEPNLSNRISALSCSSTVVNFDYGTTVASATEKNFGHLKEPSSRATDAVVVTPWVRFRTWLTPYRQILITVVMLNIAGSALEIGGLWPAASRCLSSLVIGNLLCAIAIRSEWVLRFLYWLAIKLFRPSLPIRLRVIVVGLLYHIGGLHSGCGIAALCWLLAAFLRHIRSHEMYHPAILTSLAACLVCVATLSISAFPVFRHPHHNAFEIIHRFVGWLGILCTVTFVVLSTFWNVDLQRWNVKYASLATCPDMWLLLTIFMLIIASWITVAKVPVEFLTDSKTASVIRVPGGLTSGLHTRISRGGLREWHIFGSISEGKTADCHYVVAAVQGNFTRSLNTDRPAKLYTKRWKPCGLPYFSRMFTRGVAICTGSGIGAVASTCIQHSEWFLVWIGPNLEQTYGSELLNLLTSRIPSERRIIWDTRGPHGRPDVVSVLEDIFKSWDAEVALFIGSPALNKTVLQASRTKKLPLFGSIWDA